MNTFNTITKLPMDTTLSPSSTNWGKVYQNYISVNLSSDELMQGAYDAYNLLSRGALRKFQQDAISAINALIENQNKLIENQNELIEQLNALKAIVDNESPTFQNIKVKSITFIE